MRSKKQIVAILVYLVIFSIVGFGIYSIFKKDPTCSDGKKNQSETGIDCGGQCAPCPEIIEVRDIEVVDTEYVSYANGKYDVLVRLKNPNDFYGADFFRYTIVLYDNSGREIWSDADNSYILPFDEKNIIHQNVVINTPPEDIRFTVESINWVQFQELRKPKLVFTKREYRDKGVGSSFGEIYGLMRNESDFDLNQVTISIVMRDRNNNPVYMGSTEMRTVLAGQSRDLTLQVPVRFSGEAVRIEMEGQTNVLKDENYLKLYLPGGKFQEL